MAITSIMPLIKLFRVRQKSTPPTNRITEVNITRSSNVNYCSNSYKVAFTFDDGPYPTATSIVVQTLNRQNVKAGFFLLGTTIQAFLGAHDSLIVHQFERPRLPFLLLQNYSLLDTLFDGHDIYLHGWVHENNEQMRLQTAVDNIATELVEIGVLRAFKPIYRAPWGIGTSSMQINEDILLVQILRRMGLVPGYWDIKTLDTQQILDENQLINRTLQLICEKKGGYILMHDNQPTKANLLDRLIRSIRDTGHTIVSPGEIDSTWNDEIATARSKKFIGLLRRKIRHYQTNHRIDSNTMHDFRPIQVSLGNNESQVALLRSIKPTAVYRESLIVSPNIDDI